jgi:thiamine-monophosphate kinase
LHTVQTVRDIGEFPLIERIKRLLPAGPTVGVVAGIGDDTAALKVAPRHLLLATCDVQVEGVHFLLDKTTPEMIGRKTLAVNISDVAAMGGVPRYALISLGLPPETPVEFVDGLYAGFRVVAEQFGVDIVGGNLAKSRQLFIDVTLLGEVEPDRPMYRGGARIGDRIIVTGSPGESGGGLALLLDPALSCPPDVAERLLARHQAPTPRVSAGRAVATSGAAHAMIDVSDGLVGDLGHVCEASGVGAVLWSEELPVSDDLRTLGAATGRDPRDWLLFGGEDYELLVVVERERADEVVESIRARGVAATVIGKIVDPERGIVLREADGRERKIERGGYTHF